MDFPWLQFRKLGFLWHLDCIWTSGENEGGDNRGTGRGTQVGVASFPHSGYIRERKGLGAVHLEVLMLSIRLSSILSFSPFQKISGYPKLLVTLVTANLSPLSPETPRSLSQSNGNYGKPIFTKEQTTITAQQRGFQKHSFQASLTCG